MMCILINLHHVQQAHAACLFVDVRSEYFHSRFLHSINHVSDAFAKLLSRREKLMKFGVNFDQIVLKLREKSYCDQNVDCCWQNSEMTRRQQVGLEWRRSPWVGRLEKRWVAPPSYSEGEKMGR